MKELSFGFAPTDAEFHDVIANIGTFKKLRFMEGGLDPARLAALMDALMTTSKRPVLQTLWIWKCPTLDMNVLFSFRCIVFLNLELNGFSDEAAVHMSKVLGRCESLEHLILNHNKIGDVGAQAIASALEATWSLRELQLGHNEVSDIGARALMGALDVHKRLKALNLDGNMAISAAVLADVHARFAHQQHHHHHHHSSSS